MDNYTLVLVQGLIFTSVVGEHAWGFCLQQIRFEPQLVLGVEPSAGSGLSVTRTREWK